MIKKTDRQSRVVDLLAAAAEAAERAGNSKEAKAIDAAIHAYTYDMATARRGAREPRGRRSGGSRPAWEYGPLAHG